MNTVKKDDSVASTPKNGESSPSPSSANFDEDGMPIPTGIEDVDEDELQQSGESSNMDLSKAGNEVWLVKLTPQLAGIWKQPGFLNGQQLGRIKIQKGTNPPKITLELNDSLPEHKEVVSKEYQMRLTKHKVENEYIFSEQEYDHFKDKVMYRTEVVDMPFQPKLQSLNKEAQNHAAKWTRKTNEEKEAVPDSGMGTTKVSVPGQDNPLSKFKRFVPYAKTIPKKTDLVGKVVHECQVIPTNLASSSQLKLAMDKRRLAGMVKRRRIKYLKHADTGVLQGRAGPNIHTGATITLSKDLAARREAAKSEGRAARMDKDLMMKLLFQCFNEYEYWSMKRLKERTNQPEAYLKECLEIIAIMERKGPFALKYRLKEEYRKSREVERQAQRGIDLSEMELDHAEEDDDDSDEDLEMEDVARM